MIQKETYLNIIDNSGVKKAACFHIYGGYRKRYATIGDVVLASVKSTNIKGEDAKFKKGDKIKVLILHTRKSSKSLFSNEKKHYENTGVVVSNANKLLSSRIFGSVDIAFRHSKFLKVITLAGGISK